MEKKKKTRERGGGREKRGEGDRGGKEGEGGREGESGGERGRGREEGERGGWGERWGGGGGQRREGEREGPARQGPSRGIVCEEITGSLLCGEPLSLTSLVVFCVMDCWEKAGLISPFHLLQIRSGFLA